MTAGQNNEFITDFYRRVESSGTWFYFIIGDFDFGPAESIKIKEPQIIHICNSLSSENNKIRED